MKSNITLSMDLEIIEYLKKENNYSDVVNKQIKAFYEGKKSKSLEILQELFEKKHTELKKLRKELREIKENISEIKKKEKETLDIFKKKISIYLKPDQIKWLKDQKNLDYETAVEFAVKNGLDNRGIGGIKLIKLWEEIKNVLE